MILSSCAARNFDAKQSLPYNEGLVLAKCKSMDFLHLNIYRADYVPNPIAPGIGLKAPLGCSQGDVTKDDVILVPLQEGDYIIANGGFNSNAAKFRIDAQTINYVGDFTQVEESLTYTSAKDNATLKYTRMKLVAQNNFESTRKRLFEQYPGIEKRYKIVSSFVTKSNAHLK